jgi:hypothetical protein
MTHRKGEITRARLRRHARLLRHWPHHVALSADKVRGLKNKRSRARLRGYSVGCAAGLFHKPG